MTDYKSLGIGAALAGLGLWAYPRVKTWFEPRSITIEVPLEQTPVVNTGIQQPAVPNLLQAGLDAVRDARNRAAAQGKNTKGVDNFLEIIGG